MHPNFSLGQCLITPGAQDVLKQKNVSPSYFLQKHHALERGTLCDEDYEQNVNALSNGSRIFSAFTVNDDPESEVIWVITEADRSCTTILLPDEY